MKKLFKIKLHNKTRMFYERLSFKSLLTFYFYVTETLIRRVKAVHDVIKETAAASAGIQTNSELAQPSESFLSLEEYNRVEIKLKDLLTSVCDYCNERLASLISTQSDYQSSASQITELSVIVESFTDMCETVCGKQSGASKAAFKIHAGNYIHKFHNQRKTKLTMLLDAERWKPTEVPNEIQILVDKLALSKYSLNFILKIVSIP